MSKTSEYNKLYYQKNKERILKQILEKVECDVCHCFVAKCNMNKHIKSNKHKLNEIRKKEDSVHDLVKKAIKQYLKNKKITY